MAKFLGTFRSGQSKPIAIKSHTLRVTGGPLNSAVVLDAAKSTPGSGNFYGLPP